MSTATLNFTSGSQSVGGPGTTNFNYTLPASLTKSASDSFSTSVIGYPLTGSVNVSAGLSGGIDLGLGTYTPDVPVTVNVDAPSSVGDGQTFSVDPSLVSTNDASFTYTGPGATINLDLGVSGGAQLTFNYPAPTFIGIPDGPSFSVGPSFSFGYAIPTGVAIPIPGVNGASITISEPNPFSTTSNTSSTVGSLPSSLTASGTDAPDVVAANLDLVALTAQLLDKIPGLEEVGLIDGSYGGFGASLSYSLISLPLTAGLALGQSLTLTPEPQIGVTLTDTLNGQVDSGTLGQDFSFTAPTTGSGTIPIDASYALTLDVTSQTGISGNISLALDGPQISGSILGAGFSAGPLFGPFSIFDLSTGLGTLDTSSFSQSLTQTATYDVNYGAACYLAGTRILTARGDVAVEHLVIGDVAITASGGRRPVVWLGSRRIDCSRYHDPNVVYPIRISAGAFAADLPTRDLWVSPGHSILVNGVLIQASRLINGATIELVSRARVEYWHVELDSHDCILAEGLAAESYLDTGNRTAFANGGAFLEAYPDFAPKHFRETCVPLVLDGAPEIYQAKAQLLARAQTLGYAITNDSDAHIMADGRRIEAIRFGEGRLAFMLPEGSTTSELCCRSFVPAHTAAASDDQRVLGVCVSRLQIDGSDVALDDGAAFAAGWHGLECLSAGRQRWTQARVPLPAGARLVIIDLAGPSHCWASPTTEVAALFG